MSPRPRQCPCPQTHPGARKAPAITGEPGARAWQGRRPQEATGEAGPGLPPAPRAHPPPAPSLSLRASCPCLCFPSRRSSGCCPACGPCGEAQSISPAFTGPPPRPPPRAFSTRTLGPAPHLRAPLSPSMWLSSPSPCMSGTAATRSFKKSNCCSSSMHCFLEEGGGSGQGGEQLWGQESGARKTSTLSPPPPRPSL